MGDVLYQKGGVINILWSTNSNDVKLIRNKEVDYIREYSKNKAINVVNSEKYVFSCTNREFSNPEPTNKLIKVNSSDYEKAISLLKENGIEIISHLNK